VGGGVGAERVRAAPAARRAAANEGGGGDRVAFSNRPPGVARGEWYLQGRERAPGDRVTWDRTQAGRGCTYVEMSHQKMSTFCSF